MEVRGGLAERKGEAGVKTAVFVDKERIEIREMPTPDPPAGCALVRNRASAICGSDKGLWTGPGPKPGFHGHEFAGEVVSVGRGVEKFRPDDRVMVLAVVGCGKCPECLRGRFPYCAHRGGLPQLPGAGYADHAVVLERNLVMLPDDLSFELGALLTDALGTPARAVRRSGLQAEDVAAVLGLGPIGLNAVLVLKAVKATVIGVDPVAYRRHAALRLGADVVLDNGSLPASEEGPSPLARALREITGGGPDYAFECSGKAGRDALEAVRMGGKVAFVGECASLEISPSEHFIRRHIEAFGSWYVTKADVLRNVEMVRAGLVDPLKVVTHYLPFEEIARGFALACGLEEECLKVVLQMGATS